MILFHVRAMGAADAVLQGPHAREEMPRKVCAVKPVE
jgi:hypothetical protein